MRFGFTDDHLAFRDAVRDLLAKECPPAAVRTAWTNDTGRTTTAWAALGEMGVLGALVPEAQGGLGLSEIDVVLLAEETGRFALPEKIFSSVMAVPFALKTRGRRGDRLNTTRAWPCPLPFSFSFDFEP